MKNKTKNYGYTLGEMMIVLAIVAVTITLAASFMKFMTMIVTNTYTAKKAILDADLFQRFIKGNIRSYMLLPNKTEIRAKKCHLPKFQFDLFEVNH